MAIGNLQELIPAFFTGPNGQRLTPEQIAQRQEIAQSLIGRATDTSPDAGGWASVLTKGLLGYQSGAGQREADNAIKANAESSQASIASMLGGLGLGGGAGYNAPVASGASPTSAVAMGTGTGSVNLPGNLGGIINEAASKYGVDPAAMSVIAKIESGGNPNAKNPNSSAGGAFQFIDSTAKQYGLENRFDPVQAADAAARLTRDNASILTNAIGRAPTAGELYLAHQQGGGGAAKLLANPNARAVDIVGNEAVRLNGGDANMTALQFANKWINKADRIMGSPQEAIAQVAPVDGAPALEEIQVQPNPMVAESPAAPASLLEQNDMMLGGVLSPSGSSPVAQALTGQFPQAPSMQPQQQQGGINPAVIAALSNPYASQQERQIAGMLLGQQMEQAQAQQQQAQQMAQRQSTAQTLGINPALAGDPDAWKASIEQATRNRNTVTVGNTVYDANTGQPVIQGQGDPTSDIQNYEYARNNGYGGSFADYQQEVKRAGATNIDNRQMGAVPAGYQVQYDDQGRPVSMSPIPGSPAEIEAKIAADKASSMGAAQTLSDAQKSETMMDATKSVLDIMNSASTPVTGTLSRPYALYSGSPAGKVRSYVSTLQSGVALGAMQRLKEASSTGATGFGALSAPELNILISDIGALDPDNTSPEIFKKTVERIQNNAIRTAENIVKNVSPDRIKELGLQPFIDSFTAQGKAPTGTKTKTGVTWSVN